MPFCSQSNQFLTDKKSDYNIKHITKAETGQEGQERTTVRGQTVGQREAGQVYYKKTWTGSQRPRQERKREQKG